MSQQEIGAILEQVEALPPMEQMKALGYLQGLTAAMPSQSAALTALPGGEPGTEVENG